jgi:23S rRNA pseudouridine1911/1915/1917 synthase
MTGWPRGVRVVHEDADLIVLDKPPGLLTAAVGAQTGPNLFDALKAYLRRHRNRGGRVYIIHRLDRDASGLLVFAKTERAFNWLKDDFRAKRVHRLYLALVEGEITGEGPAEGAQARTRQTPGGTIQSFIHEDEFGRPRSLSLGQVARAAKGLTARGAHPDDPRAPRLAVTHWRVVAVGQGRSLLQLRLETGRKNQIRVHMKEFGHPIVGDHRFGATTDPIRRLGLHACELGFTHPGTGQPVRFHSAAPDPFHRAVGRQPPPGEHAAPAGSVRPAPTPRPAADTSWDHVAEWYDQLIDERRSDHFEQVILPGTLRLLAPVPGMRVLDVACGQGELCRRLAASGVSAVGVDAAPRLIEAARGRNRDLPPSALPVRYEVADARELASLAPDLRPGSFDAASCVMALMNINPLEPVVRGVAGLLKPGGSFVAVILHPAFRAPGQTSWGWEAASAPVSPGRGAGKRAASERGGSDVPRPATQYRRVDGYLSPGQREIVMNPGHTARGKASITTWTFHRPIQAYVAALSGAGLLIEAIEEWPSLRASRPGPRAAEENRARREIPLFLALRAVKPVGSVAAPEGGAAGSKAAITDVY